MHRTVSCDIIGHRYPFPQIIRADAGHTERRAPCPRYLTFSIRSPPCDVTRPYIFVSYSSADEETVCRDVLTLQRHGYNLWIDIKNLDKRQPSWHDSALDAATAYNSSLVLFYVSRHSLTSMPCFEELDAPGARRPSSTTARPSPAFVSMPSRDWETSNRPAGSSAQGSARERRT